MIKSYIHFDNLNMVRPGVLKELFGVSETVVWKWQKENKIPLKSDRINKCIQLQQMLRIRVEDAKV